MCSSLFSSIAVSNIPNTRLSLNRKIPNWCCQSLYDRDSDQLELIGQVRHKLWRATPFGVMQMDP